MRALVDTNVWIDMALEREEFVKNSRGAVGVCLLEGIDILIPGTSLKDIFYIVRKKRGLEAAYSSVEDVLQMAKVAPIDDMVCRRALELEQPDYEDGLVAAAGLLANVDIIITRDEQGFSELPIAKYSPAEFIQLQGYTEIEF